MEELRELFNKRSELLEEYGRAERLKKVSIITEDSEYVSLASRKMEKLILDIEKIDQEIKKVKEAIKLRIEAAKQELSDLTANKENLTIEINNLKKDYVASGDEEILDNIEVKIGSLQAMSSKMKELEKTIENDGKIVEIEPEELDLDEEVVDNNSQVKGFVEKALAEGKDYAQIANELNERAPSTLDEYVASDEYKMLSEIYNGVHYVDSKGEIQGTEAYRAISNSRKFNLDLEKLEGVDYELAECIRKMDELVEKDIPVRAKVDEERKKGDKDLSYLNKHFEANSEYKKLEKKCVEIISKHIRDAYRFHVSEKLLNERGTDFTPWLDDALLRDSATNLMFINMDKKAKKDILPKEELREIGALGFIAPDEVESFATKNGLVEDKKKGKTSEEELMSMFSTEMDYAAKLREDVARQLS